jgi:hypothetical protein
MLLGRVFCYTFTMHFSKLFRVKDGKLDILKQWFAVLGNERREEALATFSYENIEREVFVLFKGNDGENNVISFNEANGEHRKGDTEVKINQEHNKIKLECLEPISDNGEILLDLRI